MTTPQKSAVLVIFFSGSGYLTKRRFSFFLLYCTLNFQGSQQKLPESCMALGTASHSSDLSSWENTFERSGSAKNR